MLFWGPSHLNQQLRLCFKLWCWRRLLRVPWTARRSNRSILKSWIFTRRTDAEAEALLLWPPHEKNWLTGKRPWCWERLKAGEGSDRGWYGWMASQTRWTWVWASSGNWWWTGKPGVLQSMGLKSWRHLVTEQSPIYLGNLPSTAASQASLLAPW